MTRAKHRQRALGWQPLERAVIAPLAPEKVAAQIDAAIRTGIDRKEAEAAVMHALDRAANDELWLNHLYVVHLDRHPDPPCAEGMMHLSIRRGDRKPVHDWRDLQRIKNQLAGPEAEAIELYPAESRLVDSANQFHLWVLPEGQWVPVGWASRFVTDDVEGTGVGQRPFAS